MYRWNLVNAAPRILVTLNTKRAMQVLINRTFTSAPLHQSAHKI